MTQLFYSQVYNQENWKHAQTNTYIYIFLQHYLA